ncbi:MerR family transcriptional regulator [Oscillospiraceae bacterium MB08-C2-2]|nr:MerR family transcriptional regulator [Oscillospiraceae bacterium MB08-C2-2]
MKKHTTIELAKIYHIHPNTIRLYERLNYISMPERAANNYRIFTELHIFQIEICRCIFGYPFTNRNIRNAGNEVMWASARQEWSIGKQNAERYIQIIEQEIKIARRTAIILNQWANTVATQKDTDSDSYLSRKKVADRFAITVETVRNWERNRLIVSVKKGEKGEQLYSRSDLNRISIIYMLIQAGFSIAAIQRSLTMYENGHTNEIVTALNNPQYEELVSVGDRWIHELERLSTAAQTIPSIFDKLANL